MLLDVFITTYNRSRYLKDAIESILNQTYTDFQLTILDNCSTDNTEEVVKAFNDSRVRYIKNEENLGAWGNVNKAFSLADKKYFIVNHDDDIMMPDYLEKAVSFMEENEKVSVLSLGIDNIDADADYSQCIFEKRDCFKEEVVSMYSGDEIFSMYVQQRQFIAFPTLIYRNSFMKENNIAINPDAGPSADVLLMLEIERYGGTIAKINEKYVLYRLHAEQWSQVARVEMMVKLFGFLNKDSYYGPKINIRHKERTLFFLKLLYVEVCIFLKNQISSEDLKTNVIAYVKVLEPSEKSICLAKSIIRICKTFPKTVKLIYRAGKSIKR